MSNKAGNPKNPPSQQPQPSFQSSPGPKAPGGESRAAKQSGELPPASNEPKARGGESRTANQSGELPPAYKEWLVTDGMGAFAMGTSQGIRTRKYHGFYAGIVGRAEAAFLADLEMTLPNGQSIWPHRYQGQPVPVIDPDPTPFGFRFVSSSTGETGSGSAAGPEWEWNFESVPGSDVQGVLRFAVRSQRQRGIELQWSWQSSGSPKRALDLRIRPFFAMRALHAVGGTEWQMDPLTIAGSKDESAALPQAYRVKASSAAARIQESVYLALSGKWSWKPESQWYRDFLYTEEVERGYDAEESLHSAGFWNLRLKDGESARILISLSPEVVQAPQPARRRSTARDVKIPSLDFVLHEPAGIVAGYPWFGEWGRDTFISLPGIAIRWIESGGKSHEVSAWVDDVLSRWGQWIQLSGMLPNLIEKNGSHQWESADATLWWCHALASLWAFGVSGRKEFQGLDRRFKPILDHAIQSIRSGKHVFLRATGEDPASGVLPLLEVTEPHTTWMDARVEGCAVTPRVGILPEINALWFQALCLQALWSETDAEPTPSSALLDLGRRILDSSTPENGRPNMVFFHSLPLAPSFVLREPGALWRDLMKMDSLWTPVGMRSLSPNHPAYAAQCVGTQEQRDRAYHQGTVWGWLGGHFEMAKDRVVGDESRLPAHFQGWETFPAQILDQMPIEGHIPEIFDGEEPFAFRGAPAQAWSLACMDEARARKRLRVDSKLTDLLARRFTGWGMGRENREKRTRTRNSGGDLAGGL